MSEYQIADRPASESVWRRAWADTKSFRNSLYFWMLEALFGGLATILPITFNYEAIVIAVISVVGWLFIPISVFVVSLCRAPFQQRKEARQEAVWLWKLREPKLMVSIEPWRPLYDLSAESYARDLICSFGIRISNESDGVAEGCFATITSIDAAIKFISRMTQDGISITRPDDFDIGVVRGTIPRPLIWPDGTTSRRLSPRSKTVVDVFHYVMSEERPIKLRTPRSGDMHELEDEGILFVISVGDEDGLPNYCVCKYVPNARSGENWSLMYSGSTLPDLEDYQLSEPIPANMD